MASKKLITSILIAPFSLLFVNGQNVLELINQGNVSEKYEYSGYTTSTDIRFTIYVLNKKKNDTLFIHDLAFGISRAEHPKGTKFDLSQENSPVVGTYQVVDRKKIKSNSPRDYGGFVIAADEIDKFDGTIEILEHTDSTLRIDFNMGLINFHGEKLKQYYKGERTFYNINAQQITIVDSATENYFTLDKTHLIISAFDKSNKLLWQTNPRDSLPLSDDMWRYYRTKHPIIIVFTFWIYNNEKVISIGYNNSQGGNLELKTGKFHFLGQD